MLISAASYDKFVESVGMMACIACLKDTTGHNRVTGRMAQSDCNVCDVGYGSSSKSFTRTACAANTYKTVVGKSA